MLSYALQYKHDKIWKNMLVSIKIICKDRSILMKVHEKSKVKLKKKGTTLKTDEIKSYQSTEGVINNCHLRLVTFIFRDKIY